MWQTGQNTWKFTSACWTDDFSRLAFKDEVFDCEVLMSFGRITDMRTCFYLSFPVYEFCDIRSLKNRSEWTKLQSLFFDFFLGLIIWKVINQTQLCKTKRSCVKPVLNWANVCSPEHTSDTSTNYDSFLNWTFSSPNMVRTVQTLIHSQLACNEMQASARTCGRRAADSMIENVG